MIEVWILVVLLVMLALEIWQMAHKKKHREGCECKCEWCEELRRIRVTLEQILKRLPPEPKLPTGGTISQISEDSMPIDNSVIPGQPSIFKANFTPTGSTLPSTDTITFGCDDPAVVLAPSPDGDVTKIQVTFPATGDSATSFNLAAQLTGPDYPTPLNLTPRNVTVQSTTPPPTLPSGGTIDQVS